MRIIKGNPLLIFLLISLLLWIAAVSINPFPTATLTGNYTDHLNFETEAWFFLHNGFDVFKVPMGELAAVSHALRPHVTWAELPYDKTLGNLIVFIPFGAINNLGLLPESIVSKLIICLLILIAHIAIYYFIDELRRRHAALAINATLSAIFYMLLMYWSANGFSDAISILFIILAIRFLREKRNAPSLLCYAMSVFMHYRAIYFLPLGIYALINLYREGRLSLTSLLRASTSTRTMYGSTIVMGALTVYTAYLTFIKFPYARIIDEVYASSGGIAHNPLNPGSFSLAWAIPILAITCLVILYLVKAKELLTASTIFVALLFFSLTPFFQVWYPLFLFPVALIPKEERSRVVTLCWLLLTVSILVGAAYSPTWWNPHGVIRKWMDAL